MLQDHGRNIIIRTCYKGCVAYVHVYVSSFPGPGGVAWVCSLVSRPGGGGGVWPGYVALFPGRGGEPGYEANRYGMS